MDPRDGSSIHNRHPPPPPPHHPQQQGVMMPQPTQPSFGFAHHFTNSANVFMMGPAAGVPNSANPNLISNPNFSFAPLPHPFDSGLVAHHRHQPPHHQQQPQPQLQQQGNGSQAPGVSAATAIATPTVGSEQTKKKRGRPRKYSAAPEGISLGLTSNSQPVSKAGGENEVREGNVVEGSKEKRQRGRPRGSGKKQLNAVGGASGGAGVAFHVVIVPEGENIVSKLVELSQGPRIIFVVGASGSVRNVTLRQVAGGTLYHEGQFDIATLSGSSCFVNSDGSQNNTLNLTVILAGPDGRLLGGGVTRELIAASSIQMVAGSFIVENNQSNTSPIPITSPLSTPASHMLSFGGSAPPNNSTQHDTGSESPSDESNGYGHPQNQNSGFYNFGQPWNG